MSVRYKQTVIGIIWAVLRPFLTMLIFTIIFSRIAKLPHPSGANIRTWKDPAAVRSTVTEIYQ